MVSPAPPLESGKLAPSGVVRRSRTPQPGAPPMPSSPLTSTFPPMGAMPPVSQLPLGFMPVTTTPVAYTQSIPPMAGPAHGSPMNQQHRLYPDPGEPPVVPLMHSHSSSSSGSRYRPPKHIPPPTLTRASSRASGNLSYEAAGSRPRTPNTRPPTQAESRPMTPGQTSYAPVPSRPYTPTQPKYIPAPSSPRMIPAPAPATSIYPDGSRWSPRPSSTALPIPGPSEVRYIPPPGSPRMATPVPPPASATNIYPDGSKWSPRPSGTPLPNATFSPRSSTSRLSLGGLGHQRSRSLNAGSTPAAMTRPLSKGPIPELRRVPSASSVASRQSGYSHFDPSQYRDVADLASSEDLPRMIAVQSPGTWANTQQNANVRLAPDAHARSSSALSYVSSSRV